MTSDRRVSTLAHLHSSMELITQLCSGLGEVYRTFKRTARMAYWRVVFDGLWGSQSSPAWRPDKNLERKKCISCFVSMAICLHATMPTWKSADFTLKTDKLLCDISEENAQCLCDLIWKLFLCWTDPQSQYDSFSFTQFEIALMQTDVTDSIILILMIQKFIE